MGTATRTLTIGQATRARVHASGISWDDRSGNPLRDWIGTDTRSFYDTDRVAIVPMGLRDPGRAAGDDLLQRNERAPLCHARLLAQLPRIELTLLVDHYGQPDGLSDAGYLSVTAATRNWRSLAPHFTPLPNPPRNAQQRVVQGQCLVRSSQPNCCPFSESVFATSSRAELGSPRRTRDPRARQPRIQSIAIRSWP